MSLASKPNVESSLPAWLNLPPLHWAGSLGIGVALHFGLGKPYLLPLPWPRVVALSLVGLAGIIAVVSFRCLIKAKTPWHPHQTPCVLVASGAYCVTRNPMYLGLLLLSIAAAYLLRGALMWLAPLLFFAVMNFLIIPYEERRMAAEFGEDYRVYCRRVRRWI